MADHFDAAIAKSRQSLAEAIKRAKDGNWMAEADVDAIKQTIAELEREAAIHRAKTAEQLTAEAAAREAYWQAFEEAANTKEEADEDEDGDE